MASRGTDLIQVLACPRSVAVVGASTDPRRASGRPLHYLLRYGYRGRIVPVNARHAEVAGLPAAASLAELDQGSIEAAVIALPAPAVLPALAEAEQLGVKVAVVIGSGFEDRAAALRQELDEFVTSSDMRVVGPNCVGAVAVENAACLTFSTVLGAALPRLGTVGLVTQSGALGNSLLQTLIRRHVGISQWVSSGDEADVGALELVTGLLAREGTDAVGLFLEGLTDLDWLPRVEDVLRSGHKRLFVLKAANTAAGRLAAAGHTGRVVGSAAASHAILDEIGAREVPTLSALADALVVAGTSPGLLRTPRPRLAMVSISGAAGVIGSDRMAQHDRLAMAQIDTPSATMLASRLDSRLSPANPLDVPFIDDTAAFTGAVDAFAASGVADVVLAVESGLAHDRQELSAKLPASREHAAIVLTSLSEDDQIPADVAGSLARAGIAYLPTVERAVDAIGACAAGGAAADAPLPGAQLPGARLPGARLPGAQLPEAQLPEARAHGLEWAAQRLPGGFPWAPWQVVSTLDELPDTAVRFGFPLVIKAAGRAITHRTELGAVRVVPDRAGLGRAFHAVREICEAAGDVVVMQQMVSGGFEVMVSAVRDPEYGPVAYVRPGGTLAELMSGQAVLWGGWDPGRRARVLRASVVGRLLDGYRGGARHDLAALSDLVSIALAAVAGEMSFLEMNPVMVGKEAIHVVDLIARP
jgi:acyl-CoA synthetase (NDP forming)